MPNWCYNEMFIYGPKAERDNFLSKLDCQGIETRKSFLETYLPNPSQEEMMKWEDEFHAECVKLADSFYAKYYPQGAEAFGKLSKEDRDKVWDTIPANEYEDYAKVMFENELYRKSEPNQVWYPYNRCHWGTKWSEWSSACDENEPCTQYSVNKTSTTMTFYTAWCPPEAGIVAISKQFPKLTFLLKGYESGCQFKTRLVVQDGEVSENTCKKYNGRHGG